MIQKLILWLLRDRLAELDTLSFERTEKLRATINDSLALSFVQIRQELDAIKSDLLAVKTTAQDNANDLQTTLVHLANEVDLIGGGLTNLDSNLAEYVEFNGTEIDDLEERLKDLEEVADETAELFELLEDMFGDEK